MPAHPYIAIEGAIGVGKTTLARFLGEGLSAELLLEVFEENPFLSDFYADRARYAFQTQIFFLLSRYRQQHSVIANTISRCPLVSDYLFAKDWLFAHLNLVGDELAMYERVHAILGEQIPAPALVVYLKASTDTLMERIAFRDRSYERQMSRAYLDDLRLAYDHYFTDYADAPVLLLDTDGLDIVRNPVTRADVVAKVKNALRLDSYQLSLPTMDELEQEPLVDFQRRPPSGRLPALPSRPRSRKGLHRRPVLQLHMPDRRGRRARSGAEANLAPAGATAPPGGQPARGARPSLGRRQARSPSGAGRRACLSVEDCQRCRHRSGAGLPQEDGGELAALVIV